jgi:CubicO group peptidase (beta-lactamase class C family)
MFSPSAFFFPLLEFKGQVGRVGIQMDCRTLAVVYRSARRIWQSSAISLKKGRWEDQQIISEAWLQQSTEPIVKSARTFWSRPVDYGYLWWLLPLDGVRNTDDRENTIITAAGARDQWIFVIPKYEMVVVVTGNTSDSEFARPVDFLYEDILKAVR